MAIYERRLPGDDFTILSPRTMPIPDVSIIFPGRSLAVQVIEKNLRKHYRAYNSTIYFVFSICCKYGMTTEPSMVLLASSFVMMVFGSRTFSNMIETVLFSLLLKVVVTEMLDAEKVSYSAP